MVNCEGEMVYTETLIIVEKTLNVEVQTSWKTIKCKTLNTVAVHATTACTDDASIAGLCSLNWTIV